MTQFFKSLWTRVSALFDKSALVLILPALLALYFLVDAAMVKTLVQWSVYGLVLAGITVIISRIMFPQIKLTELVEQAMQGNRAAGTIAGSLVIFVGVMMLALVIWAKA